MSYIVLLIQVGWNFKEVYILLALYENMSLLFREVNFLFWRFMRIVIVGLTYEKLIVQKCDKLNEDLLILSSLPIYMKNDWILYTLKEILTICSRNPAILWWDVYTLILFSLGTLCNSFCMLIKEGIFVLYIFFSLSNRSWNPFSKPT